MRYIGCAPSWLNQKRFNTLQTEKVVDILQCVSSDVSPSMIIFESNCIEIVSKGLNISLDSGLVSCMRQAVTKSSDSHVHWCKCVIKHQRVRVFLYISSRWRHNGSDSVSNHQPCDRLLNRLFRRRWNKTSKLRVTGLCAGSPRTNGQ